MEVERFTVPVKPFCADTVTVKEPVVPEVKLTFVGFAVMLKSGGRVLKNSVIGVALASLAVRLARFQLTSIVLVRE